MSSLNAGATGFFGGRLFQPIARPEGGLLHDGLPTVLSIADGYLADQRLSRRDGAEPEIAGGLPQHSFIPWRRLPIPVARELFPDRAGNDGDDLYCGRGVGSRKTGAADACKSADNGAT